MERKNILMLSSWYPSESKPFEGNFVQSHIEIIAERHNVFLVIFETVNRGRNPKIVQQNKKNYNNIQEIRFFVPKQNKLANYLVRRKCLQMMKKELPKIDLIHGHVIFNTGIIFAYAQKLFDVPLLISEHASLFLSNKIGKLDQLIGKFSVKRASKISTVSGILQKGLKKHLNVDSEIIPNLVAAPFYNLPKNLPEKFTFLHVSTLAKVKRVNEILDSFQEVLKHYPVLLTLVTDQPVESINQEIVTRKIGRFVKVFHQLSLREIALEMKKSSAFVMNSEHETFSVVIAEALVSDLPVVSTEVGLLKDYDEVWNLVYLVDSHNPLTAQMIHCFEDKGKTKNLLSRDEKALYSKENIAEEFDIMYAEILKV